jgi:hypothetical protein
MNSYGLVLNLGYHLSTTSTQMQLGTQNLVFLGIVMGNKGLMWHKDFGPQMTNPEIQLKVHELVLLLEIGPRVVLEMFAKTMES